MIGVEHYERLGWLLEYFEWIVDASAYSETARRIAKAFPEIKGLDDGFFEDICYYAYIWANPEAVPGPTYEFITTKDFLGPRIYEATWERWAHGKHFDHLHPEFHTENRFQKGTPALGEDIRKWLVNFPELMAPMAERYNELKLRVFHPSQDYWEGFAFLGIARSVQLLVSEAPRQLYEAAMAGTFNLD
ncbi:hypothetical protein ANO11243_034330 [Dothideomycetidae sp. 11243]|nr:hypothetical protein ANO11243_034330 [fungal sp. No.11243]